MTPQPKVCCTLDAEQQDRRRAELGRGLLAMVREYRALADGVALRLPSTAAARIAVEDFIVFERECCSFLDFSTRDGVEGEMWLEITGPAGAVEFLRGWLPADAHGTPVGAPSVAGSRLRWWGGIGVASSLVLLLCCATPMLSMALVAVGIGASAAVASTVDAVAVSLLLLSIGLLTLAWMRRRRAASCGC